MCIRDSYNALVYALSGEGWAGTDMRPIKLGQLATFGEGDAIRLEAKSELDLFIMGGQPIREPVVHYGPFVMNTKAELQQAFEDFQKGRLGTIPATRLPHTD